MSWFYEHITVRSEKNGLLHARRFFGEWNLKLGDIIITGTLTKRKFRKTFEDIPSPHKVKNILVLGLGAGACLVPINEFFSGTEVIGIEYDHSIIELIPIFKYDTSNILVKVLEGDVAEMLPNVTEKFDLVIIDLFFGEHIAPVMFQEWFFHSLSILTNPQGCLLINYFMDKDQVSLPEPHFQLFKQVRYRYNTLGLYKKN